MKYGHVDPTRESRL